MASVVRVTPPAATSAAAVRLIAQTCPDLATLDEAVSQCRACPRLVEWREQVAIVKRRSFADQTYWGRPAPGFGDSDAQMLILGLAPAAHGANRTGRVFTGDRSGDFLYAALYRAGLANQPTSVSADDGLHLTGVRIIAAVRCAPPANKPTPDERDTCVGWLDRELALLPNVTVIIALGGFAWSSALAAVARAGQPLPSPRPRFGHGAQVDLGRYRLIGCYHVSQQNTFTGRLTETMVDDILTRAQAMAR